MSVIHRADVERVAKLARLHLSPDEVARLAPALEGITRDFSTLADKAQAMPATEDAVPGALREDVVHPTDEAEADAILRAAGDRVDKTTREYVVKK